ncbi:MAG TPA: tetratricopeptide repeat protein [Gemmatimonadaceae bacterium]|nr:tetratricopeptide repeat protein [Gemmatimonadaceae bacterium]
MIAARGARGAAALLAALSLQGCLATRQDVTLLQGELRALRASVAASDSARAQDARTLLAAVRRTDDSLRAVSVRVGRFQAAVSEEFREVGRQLISVQELTGQSQRRLQELRASLEDQAPSAAAPAPAPGTPDAAAGPALPGPNRLFELAREQLDRGSPSSARSALDTLIVRYPSADVVPAAQFFVAEAYAQEGNGAAADSVYQLVHARYPRSDRAPTALYKLAQSRRAAGQAAAARQLLERIVRDYPRSDEAALARDLLRTR